MSIAPVPLDFYDPATPVLTSPEPHREAHPLRDGTLSVHLRAQSPLQPVGKWSAPHEHEGAPGVGKLGSGRHGNAPRVRTVQRLRSVERTNRGALPYRFAGLDPGDGGGRRGQLHGLLAPPGAGREGRGHGAQLHAGARTVVELRSGSVSIPASRGDGMAAGSRRSPGSDGRGGALHSHHQSEQPDREHPHGGRNGWHRPRGRPGRRMDHGR